MRPRHVRRFRHDGKSYIAYEGGVPGFKPGTLVATGYAVSVVADGHRPTPDELAAALDTVEAKWSIEEARGWSIASDGRCIAPLVLKRRAAGSE